MNKKRVKRLHLSLFHRFFCNLVEEDNAQRKFLLADIILCVGIIRLVF